MAMEIIKFNTEFDFKRITLANPEPLQSSTYFTKISLENNKPFCIQLPKCQTKQGLVDIKGTKYCDLMYERSVNEDLMTWLEQLEYACQDKLCEKKDLWFQTELSRDDIESMMSPLMRLYQSGKYILIRTSLTAQKINGLEKSIAYNEQEVTIDLDKLDAADYIVPLLIIHGIKFSARSFELDIRLAQMMVFNKPTESPCLIKYVGMTNSLDIKQTNEIREKLLAPVLKTKTEKETPIINTEPIIKEKEKIYIKNGEKETEKEKEKDKNIIKIDKSHVNPTIKPLEAIIIDTPALEEVSLEYADIADTISLKKPNEVYYEIYKVAREKAKQLRKVAMEAYLEAKEIKTKYMLSDFDDSDEDSDEEESDVSDQEES
jgi:hypothetical protein